MACLALKGPYNGVQSRSWANLSRKEQRRGRSGSSLDELLPTLHSHQRNSTYTTQKAEDRRAPPLGTNWAAKCPPRVTFLPLQSLIWDCNRSKSASGPEFLASLNPMLTMGLGAARAAGSGRGGGGSESNESSESSDQAESVGAWECAKKVPTKGAGKCKGGCWQGCYEERWQGL